MERRSPDQRDEQGERNFNRRPQRQQRFEQEETEVTEFFSLLPPVQTLFLCFLLSKNLCIAPNRSSASGNWTSIRVSRPVFRVGSAACISQHLCSVNSQQPR